MFSLDLHQTKIEAKFFIFTSLHHNHFDLAMNEIGLVGGWRVVTAALLYIWLALELERGRCEFKVLGALFSFDFLHFLHFGIGFGGNDTVTIYSSCHEHHVTKAKILESFASPSFTFLKCFSSHFLLFVDPFYLLRR